MDVTVKLNNYTDDDRRSVQLIYDTVVKALAKYDIFNYIQKQPNEKLPEYVFPQIKNILLEAIFRNTILELYETFFSADSNSIAHVVHKFRKNIGIKSDSWYNPCLIPQSELPHKNPLRIFCDYSVVIIYDENNCIIDAYKKENDIIRLELNNLSTVINPANKFEEEQCEVLFTNYTKGNNYLKQRLDDIKKLKKALLSKLEIYRNNNLAHKSSIEKIKDQKNRYEITVKDFKHLVTMSSILMDLILKEVEPTTAINHDLFHCEDKDVVIKNFFKTLGSDNT